MKIQLWPPGKNWKEWTLLWSTWYQKILLKDVSSFSRKLEKLPKSRLISGCCNEKTRMPDMCKIGHDYSANYLKLVSQKYLCVFRACTACNWCLFCVKIPQLSNIKIRPTTPGFRPHPGVFSSWSRVFRVTYWPSHYLSYAPVK